MNKSVELKKIALEIERCRICKIGKSGKAVVGEGNSDAKVVFIGEAPGRKEAETGRPFIGRSGQLLRSLIGEVGLKEEEVFITSPVKYLPDRGTPTLQDIIHGKIHLNKQLEIINPQIIVLLGNVAVQGVLGRKIPVGSAHGEILRLTQDDKKYFVTFHPAAGLRFPPLKKKLISDFKKLKKVIQ